MTQSKGMPAAVERALQKGGENCLVIEHLETGRIFRYDLPDNSLDPMFSLYYEAINSLPDKLKIKYQDVADEISPSLERIYGISPKYAGFKEWFLDNRKGPFFTIYEFIDNEHEQIQLTFELNEAEFKKITDPEVMDRDLGEYCQWRRNRLLAELSTIELKTDSSHLMPNNQKSQHIVPEDYRKEQFRLELNYWRRKYILEKKTEKVFDWLGTTQVDPGQILYVVKSFSSLRNDLEGRLTTSIHRKELLESELNKISAAIDRSISFKIKHQFRQVLNEKRPIDLTQFGNGRPETGMKRLAVYWDIIQYEKYIKNRIAEFEAGEKLINKSVNALPVSSEPNQQLPPLHIAPRSQQALFNNLRVYVDELNHKILEDLIINGIIPNSQINVTCLVKEFGLAFFQSSAVMESGAKLLSEQIPSYFIRTKGNTLLRFNPSNLVKYLRGSRRERLNRNKT